MDKNVLGEGTATFVEHVGLPKAKRGRPSKKQTVGINEPNQQKSCVYKYRSANMTLDFKIYYIENGGKIHVQDVELSRSGAPVSIGYVIQRTGSSKFKKTINNGLVSAKLKGHYDEFSFCEQLLTYLG